MKWKYISLPDNDPKARKRFLENLSMGAMEHTLSRKLLSRFSEAAGSLLAVAFESLDLDRLTDYSYAIYGGGGRWHDATGGQCVSQSDSPIGGLILFVKEFLCTSKDALVFCENWSDTRTQYLANWRPRESRVLFYGDDVYHVLTSKDNHYDSIECAIRESSSPWATGVCSQCESVLQEGEILSEILMDLIVENTAHIFTSAFDGEGYLVWSPGEKPRSPGIL